MSAAADPDDDPRTVWPFVAAVSVFALVVLGIVVAALVSPADENVSDANRIQTAVNNFVAATNNDDDSQQRAAVCSTFDTAKSPLLDKSGKISVERVEAAAVDGDTAQAAVTIERDDTPDPVATWKFARADGEWRVCS